MKEYSLYEAAIITGIPRSHLQNAVVNRVLEARPRSVKGSTRILYYVGERELNAFKARYLEERAQGFPEPIVGVKKKFKTSEEELRVAQARHKLELMAEEKWLKEQLK